MGCQCRLIGVEHSVFRYHGVRLRNSLKQVMSVLQGEFPLSGVIGIVDTAASLLQEAVQRELQCVEIRADLLRSAGLGDEAVLTLVRDAKAAGLACLFTLRHQDQGGTFTAAETERVAFCKKALDAGADIIDLEYGTEAADEMLLSEVPVILSYHNFEGMLSQAELHELSHSMEAKKPAAVKIIPTGHSLADAATMLEWVSAASQSIQRIGFTMGSDGSYSRILTCAHGAPISYASFGEPVAPGQIDIDDMLQRYRIMDMSPQSRIVALVGGDEQVQSYLASNRVSENKAKEHGGHHTQHSVHLAFSNAQLEQLQSVQQSMKIAEIIVL